MSDQKRFTKTLPGINSATIHKSQNRPGKKIVANIVLKVQANKAPRSLSYGDAWDGDWHDTGA